MVTAPDLTFWGLLLAPYYAWPHKNGLRVACSPSSNTALGAHFFFRKDWGLKDHF